MPQAFKEHTLTLIFNENGPLGNEVKIMESVLKKLDKIASKPGFRKDFTSDEIDMIQSLSKVNDIKVL